MRPDASHQPSASPVYRFVSAGVHRCSGGLTSGSDGHRRRMPRNRVVLRVPASAPYRAQAHIAPLPASTDPDSPCHTLGIRATELAAATSAESLPGLSGEAI